MRPANDVVRISVGLVLVAGAIAVTTGCAPVAYRVPGIEVQRLARLDPLSRGAVVRVVPRTAPLMPAVSRPPAPPPSVMPAPPQAAPPPPEAPPPPGPYDQVPPPVAIDDQPLVEPAQPFEAVNDSAVNVEVDVPVDVGVRVGPVRPTRLAPVYPARPAPAPRVVTGVAVSGGGGGWRGSPPAPAPRPTPTAGGGGWRGTPVSAPVRSRPGGATFGGGHRVSVGHHHGGGGSGATAAVVGVVAVVGLVAAVAVAADHAQRVEVAHSYDGWVAVAPDHPVHLHYGGNRVRVVALADLQLDDTIGLQYAVLRASEGEIRHLRRTPAAAGP